MSNKHDTYSIQHIDTPEANLKQSVQSDAKVWLLCRIAVSCASGQIACIYRLKSNEC